MKYEEKLRRMPITQALDLPSVGYSPTDTVIMEGRLFRSLVTDRHHSKIWKIAALIFTVVILILPALLTITITLSTIFQFAERPLLFLVLFAAGFALSTFYVYASIKVLRKIFHK